jgi:hypothetical protein
MFAIDAQRDGKSFIVRADESLTAFLDLERGRSALAANDRDACLVIAARRAGKLQLSGRSFFWLFFLTQHLNLYQNALGVRA